jgi:hypothetical protein
MSSFVRCRLAPLCVSLMLLHTVAAQQSSEKTRPAEPRGLVPPSDNRWARYPATLPHVSDQRTPMGRRL